MADGGVGFGINYMGRGRVLIVQVQLTCSRERTEDGGVMNLLTH